MKYYYPLIVFLDEDLSISAQSMNNMHLEINIKHVFQSLFNSIFYFIGIRNKKAYEFYFSKERKSESMMKWFSDFPLAKGKFPKFISYNSVESRWTRKCLEHFQYMTDYLEELLAEHFYRFSRDHEFAKAMGYLKMIPINLGLQLGIVIPQAHLKKIIIPWKNLAPQFRKKNLIDGYRKYYKSLIVDPLLEYNDVKRDIPEWLFDKNNLEERNIII